MTPFFELQKQIDGLLQQIALLPDSHALLAETRKIYARLESPIFTTPATLGYTVATLPAGTIGMRAYVTDATAPTYNAALVGGGAVTVPVFYNGVAWVSA